MKTYIALLRGINVSGQKKVPMAELRELLETSGLQNLRTYIQSGNVIFNASNQNSSQLEKQIKKAIMEYFSFDVSVLVKTPKEIQSILENAPFSDKKPEQIYFTLLSQIPDPNLVQELRKINYPNEGFIITDYCVYGYRLIGFGRAKCSNNFFERKLKVSSTSRNYNTMMKLLSLSKEIEVNG